MKITHQPSAVIVYKTTDYKAFQFINGNRGLNEAKIKKGNYISIGPNK